MSDFTYITKTTFNIVNTFGFGVYRNEKVRLWIGPRLNIQFSEYTHDFFPGEDGGEFGIGIAPATGVNVSLGRVVSLAADIDYKQAFVTGSKTSNTGHGYGGVNEGVTARFYVLFKFGETFSPVQATAVDATDDSI